MQEEVFSCLGLTYIQGLHVCKDEHVCSFKGERERDIETDDEKIEAHEGSSPASVMDLAELVNRHAQYCA